MNLTTRELDLKLKLNEYERLDGNIKEKLWKHAKILFVFSKKHDNVILFQKLKYILVKCTSNNRNKKTVILLVRENNKWLIRYINNDGIMIRKYSKWWRVSEYLGGLKWITIMK